MGKIGLIKWGVQLIVGALPSMKKAFFVDGKFMIKRVVALFVFLVAVVLGVYIVGPENMEVAVDLLEDISDIIGHAE